MESLHVLGNLSDSDYKIYLHEINKYMFGPFQIVSGGFLHGFYSVF